MAEQEPTPELTSQAAMHEWYGALTDRITLEGVDEHASVVHFDIGPQNLFLEDDPLSYEVRICHDGTLQVEVLAEGNLVELYNVGKGEDGWYQGRDLDIQWLPNSDEPEEESYPLTTTRLARIKDKLDGASVPKKESTGEKLARVVSRNAEIVSSNASPGEILRFIELAEDMRLYPETDRARVLAALREWTELEGRVIARARGIAEPEQEI